MSPAMARLAAAQRGGAGAVALSDFGQGLPLRGASLDGALSISAVQVGGWVGGRARGAKKAKCSGHVGGCLPSQLSGRALVGLCWHVLASAPPLTPLPLPSANPSVRRPSCSGCAARPTRPPPSAASPPPCTTAWRWGHGPRCRSTQRVSAGRLPSSAVGCVAAGVDRSAAVSMPVSVRAWRHSPCPAAPPRPDPPCPAASCSRRARAAAAGGGTPCRPGCRLFRCLPPCQFRQKVGGRAGDVSGGGRHMLC